MASRMLYRTVRKVLVVGILGDFDKELIGQIEQLRLDGDDWM